MNRICPPLLFFVVSTPIFADDAVDFGREVLPILSNKCFVCHGPDAREEDALRLDTQVAATADRGGYRAINLQQPEKSRLLTRIHSTDDPMPPDDAEKQLTDAERVLLTRWIKQGGEYTKHWAFVPPVKATIAKSAGREIDAFIYKQLVRRGVDFAPAADRETLARRVALVLTGLPPELEQLRAFLADKKAGAYGRYVDELLTSPRFGEHQARYWLDAVRYGDTHGLHLDNKRGIYPYRDWVVRAFNENLPLDQFITWQLAGDLLPNPTLSQLVATGYVRMNPTTGEGGAIPAEFQAKNNFDRVETFGTVFLGMSLTCARCHTHKYDPIPQTEYYRLLAFFNSTAEPSMDGNKYEYGPTIKVPADQAAWDEWEALVSQRTKLSQQAADDETKALQQRLTAAEKAFTTSLIAKDLPQPRTTQLLKRGEYDLPMGEPLQPGVLAILGTMPEGAPRDRRGLAAWLTTREHPLVSRVLVNRIWQRTFGEALVRTPEDFGLQGQQPTHPQLLDWLAVELQESGWNLKQTLRLMVTSETFRQRSTFRNDVDDPENRLFARGPSYRLDAEVLRDIGLWSSELLDPHMGGEGVRPYQPAGMWKALAHPGSNTKQYQRDQGKRLYRRSLYVYWKRTSPHPMMTLFDAPDRESSCVRRSRTNTALQSLGLLNETQRIEMARMLAERTLKQAKDDQSRLSWMFRLLTCRDPNARERSALSGLLATMRTRYESSEKDAVALLATGEATRDKQLAPQEHAAWTQVAITLLASDPAILLY